VARAARLRHVSDDGPGITRQAARHGLDYRDVHGELISDVETPETRQVTGDPAGVDPRLGLGVSPRRVVAVRSFSHELLRAPIRD
jgi:hypothetical protein